jgi:hypothetical protein
MDDHDVRISASGNRQRLPRPHGDHVHAAAVAPLEVRQDRRGQPRVGDAGRRGQAKHGAVRRLQLGCNHSNPLQATAKGDSDDQDRSFPKHGTVFFRKAPEHPRVRATGTGIVIFLLHRGETKLAETSELD